KSEEDNHQQRYAEQAPAGRNVAAGPMGEKPRSDGNEADDDGKSHQKGELACAAMEGAGEIDLAGAEGDGELRLKGAVDELHHLERGPRDGARGGEDNHAGRTH